MVKTQAERKRCPCCHLLSPPTPLRALILAGGWEGHEPAIVADLCSAVTGAQAKVPQIHRDRFADARDLAKFAQDGWMRLFDCHWLSLLDDALLPVPLLAPNSLARVVITCTTSRHMRRARLTLRLNHSSGQE